jgi:hypothetical protein
MMFVVFLFFYVFSFGANKENLLHVILCGISFYGLIEIHLQQNCFNIHVIDILTCNEFFMFEHAHIFSLVTCIHLKCYASSDAQIIIYALCEKKD